MPTDTRHICQLMREFHSRHWRTFTDGRIHRWHEHSTLFRCLGFEKFRPPFDILPSRYQFDPVCPPGKQEQEDEPRRRDATSHIYLGFHLVDR